MHEEVWKKCTTRTSKSQLGWKSESNVIPVKIYVRESEVAREMENKYQIPHSLSLEPPCVRPYHLTEKLSYSETQTKTIRSSRRGYRC